jgi:uncharacterized protein YjbI with pentapeptide repeats
MGAQELESRALVRGCELVRELICEFLIHRRFIGVGYDGSQNVTDEERSLEEKEAHKGKRKPWTFREFGGKTVWDWMDLLIVPLALVAIGLVFTMLQDARQQEIENQRAQQAQKIENKRAEAERELAEQRAQDEALQAYLDQMSGLLLERDLRASEEDSEVRTLARARTLTVLGRLDPSRKADVIQFLVEADLVQRADGRDQIIGLSGADLSGANLSEADLSEADLSEANLSETVLRGAFLSEANLCGVFLHDADLSDADLSWAVLSYANLSGAFLRDANLFAANLSSAEGITNEQLDAQAESLEVATIPNGQKYENWLKDRKKRQQDE